MSALYVGNLSYRTTEPTVREVFAIFGPVNAVRIIRDQESGRSRGYGFVEMASDRDAVLARRALDGKVLEGRPIHVNEASPPPVARPSY